MKSLIKVLGFVSIFTLLACGGTIDPAPEDCTFSTLELSLVTVQNSSDCGSSDGSFTVAASGGSEVYSYRIMGQNLQSSPIFQDVPPGIYQVMVQDNVGCTAELEVMVATTSGLVIDDVISIDSGCGESNGSLSVAASGGEEIMYKLNDGDFKESNVFENLEAGTYLVTIKDRDGCTFFGVHKVLSGVPFTAIKGVIDMNCTVVNCHDGSRSGLPDFSTDLKIVEFSKEIKDLTTNGSMPLASSGLSLTDAEIEAIRCWVDDGAILN